MDLFRKNYREKYLKATAEAVAAHRDYAALLSIYNALVRKINQHGGSSLFHLRPNNQFTEEELKTIFILCHPDKHEGSVKSTEMTQRIGEVRASATAK